MRLNKELAGFRDEIPVLLGAVRAWSGLSLLELCSELSPILSSSTPGNLRQQWLRWTAGTQRLRLVGVAEAGTKERQVPTLEHLTRIHKEAVRRRWVEDSVPGAERLCEFLTADAERRQAELAARIRARRRRSVNEFVDRMVQDYLHDESETQLWQTLPVGVGEALGAALVESLRRRLVFELPGSSKRSALAKARAKAYNAVGEEDAYSKSVVMLTDIADNFSYTLTEYAEKIRHQKIVRAAEIEQEVREHEEMIAAALEDDAAAAGVPGDEDNEPKVPGLFKKTRAKTSKKKAPKR
jgi:hypothetical protein